MQTISARLGLILCIWYKMGVASVGGFMIVRVQMVSTMDYEGVDGIDHDSENTDGIDHGS